MEIYRSKSSHALLYTRKKIGNGESTFLWYDDWLPQGNILALSGSSLLPLSVLIGQFMHLLEMEIGI